MRGPVEVHRSLIGAQVRHEVLLLDRRIADAAEIPAAARVDPGACVVLRIYLAGDDGTASATTTQRPVAVAVPAGPRPERDAVAAAVDALGLPAAGLRAATSAETSAITDQHAGLVSPVGLPAGVPLIADSRLGAHIVLYAATGDAGTVLGIRAKDLWAVTGAVLYPLTATQPTLPAQPPGVLPATPPPAAFVPAGR